MTPLRLRDERGWVLVSATVLMTIMLSLGLVALSLVDGDSNRSREQRERESALNLDEGVLYAQGLTLATYWPNADQPAPAWCTSAGAVVKGCPDPSVLAAANGGSTAASFGNVDQLADTTWTTKVRDNGGYLKTSYDPNQADLPQDGCSLTPCTFDANQDNEVWVQAQSIVRGKPRNVVARLRLEEIAENTPRTAVVAGALSVTNKGNHGGTPIIQATGSQVLVRCPLSSSNCLQSEPGQIDPPPTSQGDAPLMMTPDQLQRFKQRAITDGRYYPGCPTMNANGKYDLRGQVVFVEGCTSPPNFANKVLTEPCPSPSGMAKTCVNREDRPGLLIWHCGRADFSGGFTYRGVIYIANGSDGTCPAGLGPRGDGTCQGQSVDESRDVMTTSGGFAIWGALAIDGAGCLKVGSNGLQINFDPRVFDSVESYGTVGLVQNTWRELNPKDI